MGPHCLGHHCAHLLKHSAKTLGPAVLHLAAQQAAVQSLHRQPRAVLHVDLVRRMRQQEALHQLSSSSHATLPVAALGQAIVHVHEQHVLGTEETGRHLEQLRRSPDSEQEQTRPLRLTFWRPSADPSRMSSSPCSPAVWSVVHTATKRAHKEKKKDREQTPATSDDPTLDRRSVAVLKGFGRRHRQVLLGSAEVGRRGRLCGAHGRPCRDVAPLSPLPDCPPKNAFPITDRPIADRRKSRSITKSRSLGKGGAVLWRSRRTPRARAGEKTRAKQAAHLIDSNAGRGRPQIQVGKH